MQEEIGQGSLFDPLPKHIPANITVEHTEERKRLSSQCMLILKRLREGRVTNRELSEISLKYTGRMSEIRVACRLLGYSPEVVERDYATGQTVYDLVPWPPPETEAL